MDYMKKKTPIKGLLFYAIQGLDAPISLSLDGNDVYVTDNIGNLHLRNITHPCMNASGCYLLRKPHRDWTKRGIIGITQRSSAKHIVTSAVFTIDHIQT